MQTTAAPKTEPRTTDPFNVAGLVKDLHEKEPDLQNISWADLYGLCIDVESRIVDTLVEHFAADIPKYGRSAQMLSALAKHAFRVNQTLTLRRPAERCQTMTTYLNIHEKEPKKFYGALETEVRNHTIGTLTRIRSFFELETSDNRETVNFLHSLTTPYYNVKIDKFP